MYLSYSAHIEPLVNYPANCIFLNSNIWKLFMLLFENYYVIIIIYIHGDSPSGITYIIDLFLILK